MAKVARLPQTGFTLIELVITVSIVGILASLAIPGMRHLVLTQHVRAAASDLQTSLFLARSEAIKRAANVSVVPVSNAWTNGWTVQLADATVLRTEDALSTNLSATSGTTITYLSNGRVLSLPSQIVFKTPSSNVNARCVSLDLSGRPSMLNGASSTSC